MTLPRTVCELWWDVGKKGLKDLVPDLEEAVPGSGGHC